jgi:single-stranded-DNA-specific exonuclease
VNPNRKDDKSGLGMLAGVGVAFYLALALRKTLRGRGYFAKKKEPNLKNLMDLVAFGTIADLAPLTGVNKVLVREGLKVLRENPSPGIEALKEIAGLPVGAYSRPITTTDIGFTLGPRVNAAGRLGSPDTALRLLIETDPQKAKEWAEELQRLNTERKGVQEEVFEKAKAQVEAMGEDLRGRRSLVLFADDWHQGVLGIVAAKISQKFHRPTVVIQFEEEGEEAIGKASVRGYGRINVYERLADCAHHLEQFGGHAAAAGLSVKRKKLQAFIESFEKSFHMNTKEEDFLPQIDVDAKAKSDEITPRLLDELEALGPFGMKNPEPVLLIEGQTRKSVLLKGKHLKLQFDHLDAIGFGLGQREWLPEEGKGLRIVGTPEWNYWKGQRKIQIRLQDFDQ